MILWAKVEVGLSPKEEGFLPMGCDLHGRGLVGITAIFADHSAATTSTLSKANIIASDCSISSVPLALAGDNPDRGEEMLSQPFLVGG